jgi:hypothetical protein
MGARLGKEDEEPGGDKGGEDSRIRRGGDTARGAGVGLGGSGEGLGQSGEDAGSRSRLLREERAVS